MLVKKLLVLQSAAVSVRGLTALIRCSRLTETGTAACEPSLSLVSLPAAARHARCTQLMSSTDLKDSGRGSASHPCSRLLQPRPPSSPPRCPAHYYRLSLPLCYHFHRSVPGKRERESGDSSQRFCLSNLSFQKTRKKSPQTRKREERKRFDGAKKKKNRPVKGG